MFFTFLDQSQTRSNDVAYRGFEQAAIDWVPPCLDLRITLTSSWTLELDLYDKLNDFSINANNYMNFITCMHKSIFVNIVLNFGYRIKNPSSDKFKKNRYNNIKQSTLKNSYPDKLINSIVKFKFYKNFTCFLHFFSSFFDNEFYSFIHFYCI